MRLKVIQYMKVHQISLHRHHRDQITHSNEDYFAERYIIYIKYFFLIDKEVFMNFVVAVRQTADTHSN